jgi:hypothetical protein
MTDPSTTPRHRSSPFPFIGLQAAIERARAFHSKQRDHAAPIHVAASLWGLGAKSSTTLQTVAALKQFGLMRDDGGAGTERKLALTPLAIRIVRDGREVSPDRARALQDACLTPKIHRELWERYGGDLPDTGTVLYFLESERGGFTERSAKELIAVYRDSVRFAGLDQSDSVQAIDDRLSDMATLEQPNYEIAESRTPAAVVAGRERVVFSHEVEPDHHVRLLVSGDMDQEIIDAVELFIQLQRKRLERRSGSTSSAMS